MPFMKKDPHSGAIVFHLTEDEKQIKNLKGELESMKQELADMIASAKATQNSKTTKK